MSYADRVFIENCRKILSEGVWDKGFNVVIPELRGHRGAAMEPTTSG